MRTGEVSAAIQQVARDEILPKFRALDPDDIVEKQPGDVVTVADRRAERALTAIFRAADPGCLVVGEEGVFADPAPLQTLPSAEHAWVIDPIDGTRNFTAGSPDFAVMVAEVRDGDTTRSWIWQPIHERLYVAEKGAGVRCNGRLLAAPAQSARPTGALHGRYGRLPTEIDDVELVRLAGCCGVDYPHVVDGERAFLGYWSMHPWDHLPGALMVNELGGRVATVEGRDYAAGVDGHYLIAAATPELWQRAEALVHRQFAR